jgi:UDP-N-acetylglucosamine--N-acetylmuramyl-(pentapeptide) pyrophosphoryl-undecaprenol N-acetylglucosamine transferase
MATFVMAGGGTGGHVIPALAVARELRTRGHSVRFIGTRRGMEAKLVPAENFPIEWIEIGGLKSVGIRKTLSTLAELPWSVWQAARMLDRAKPVVAVFSTGGFVAGPVLLAALWKRLPVVVMEPNAVPGFTHRKLGRWVARALVSFPESEKFFAKGRTEMTGMPVREEFFSVPTKQRADKLTILITGGSQGSRPLNQAVEESWPLWAERKIAVRLIHQTGAAAYEEIAARFHKAKIDGEITAFLSDMPGAFSEADIVISRSGMGTVSELAASGRPSILVPLPTASDQHQLRNAEAFEKAGAAKLIPQSELTGARLVEEIAKLANAPGALEKMSAAARAVARPGAAKRAAEVLEALGGET